MKRLLFLLALVPSLFAQEAPGLRHRDVRVLELSGAPYERGLAHGSALKAEIHELVGDFKADLAATHGLPADEFIERFLEDTNFQPAIERWVPGLLDEVRGIADGAELPFETLYAYQLVDEIWSMGSWSLRDKCTAVAVGPRGDQPAIVAQNMDIPGFYQKYPTLLRIRREAGPDSLVLTCPGLVGVNGMNSAAVAVACNTLLQLRPSPEGVPCLFVVRGVLEQQDLATASAWLREIPHAVGQNYTLGDPRGVLAFECSAKAKVPFLPDSEGDFTFHTNHPLENTDWHPDYLTRCERLGVLPSHGLPDCGRFETLEERFLDGAPITLPLIKSALASRADPMGPICGDWTYGCTVFLLKEEPQLLLAPGRSDRFAFQTFGF